MNINSKEHHELIEHFERLCSTGRTDKEPKELWPKGYVYQDGETNHKFIAFRQGYALAKHLYQA